MSFNDLVRRLHDMENGNDGAASKNKPLNELDPDRRAVKETANVLQAFDSITEGRAPSAEIIDDMEDEEFDAPKAKTRTAPKAKKRPEPDENALDPVVESSQYDFSDEEVVNEDDDLSSAIRQRFSQFMQNEVKGGADLDTISGAVNEGSDEAKHIHSVFQNMTKTLELLVARTQEGGKFYDKIEAEGGDTKQLMKANKKLEEALAAMRKSHTYAMSHEIPPAE